jgi:disulfide bond formation protein DsbB
MSEAEEDQRGRWRAYIPLLLGLVVVVAGWAVFTSPDLSAGGDGGNGDAAPPQTVPGGGGSGEGNAAFGESIYGGTCSACHGPDAEGIDGLGKPLVASAFIQSLDDEQLVAFINEGRPADHPDNTTGVAMLPKGGNPSLSDQDIVDIVAFLRTLN